jgi:hypothetical protein
MVIQYLCCFCMTGSSNCLTITNRSVPVFCITFYLFTYHTSWKYLEHILGEIMLKDGDLIIVPCNTLTVYQSFGGSYRDWFHPDHSNREDRFSLSKLWHPLIRAFKEERIIMYLPLCPIFISALLKGGVFLFLFSTLLSCLLFWGTENGTFLLARTHFYSLSFYEHCDP